MKPKSRALAELTASICGGLAAFFRTPAIRGEFEGQLVALDPAVFGEQLHRFDLHLLAGTLTTQPKATLPSFETACAQDLEVKWTFAVWSKLGGSVLSDGDIYRMIANETSYVDARARFAKLAAVCAQHNGGRELLYLLTVPTSQQQLVSIFVDVESFERFARAMA